MTDNSSLELNNDRLLFKGDWNLLSLAQLKQNYVAIRHDLKDVQVFDFPKPVKYAFPCDVLLEASII